jgi:hypothetical protein
MLVDTSGRESRRARLNEIRAKGRLPALSPLDTQALEAEFNTIARQIGTRDAIRINSPLIAGKLGVWITSPTASLRELTGADYGNAVYDATLDTVFIDRALVVPDDLLAVYSHSSYSAVASFNGAPYLRTLLQFVFAHEMAHREHHRVSAGAFDSGWFWRGLPWNRWSARKREIEADQYAFDALTRLYSHEEKPRTNLFPLLSAPIYDIPVGDLADPKQAASLEFASAFLMASTAQFFTGTPYGGYHEDTAHPNIFARMNLLLLNLARSLPSSDSVNGLDALKSVVERLSRPPTIPVAEVIAPWPIGMAGGSREKLRVVGADDPEVIEIPWKTVRRSAVQHESERLEARGHMGSHLTQPSPRKFASPDGFLFTFTEEGRGHSLPRGFPLPQPGTYVASEPARSGDLAQLEVRDSRGAKKCVASLADPSRPGRGIPELGRSMAAPLAIYVELIDLDQRQDSSEAENLRRWLRIDPRSCQSRLMTYRVPRDVQSRWRQGLWSFVFTQGIERPVWVGPLGAGLFSVGAYGSWETTRPRLQSCGFQARITTNPTCPHGCGVSFNGSWRRLDRCLRTASL